MNSERVIKWSVDFEAIKDIEVGFGVHKKKTFKELILNNSLHKYIHWLKKAMKQNEDNKDENKKSLPDETNKRIKILTNEFYNNKELRVKMKEIIPSMVTDVIKKQIIESITKSLENGLNKDEIIAQLDKDLITFKSDC